MNLSDQTREILFLILAMLIGALAGVGALAFLALVELGQWAIWPRGEHFLARVMLAPWWLKLLVPTLGGLAVGPVIAFWAPEARGPGVSEVIEAEALRGGYILPRSALVKAWCTGLTIATGGSVGREGPVVGIGAALGSFMARSLNLSPEQARICLACGAAAGIAATFNAPIAGALFAIEIILADLEILYLGHIILAALVAVLISRQFLGDLPVFHVSPFALRAPGELWLYLALGILAGLLAILFTKAVFLTDAGVRRLPLPDWLKPALGGLFLGLVGIMSPYVLGVGYDGINLSLAGKFALTAALFLLLGKFVATVICLGSGMSGGIFGPSLFLGAMLGTSLAAAANYFFPQLHLNPPDYALVGMGAVVSGTTLGPITAILIVMELGHSPWIVVPCMVGCVASYLMVKYFYGYSTYETKLLRRGVKLIRGHEVHILQSLKVKDYMAKDMEVIHDDTPLPEVVRKAEASPYPFFVVLNEHEELSGVLTLWDLREVLGRMGDKPPGVSARELKSAPAVTVTPEDNFETAFNLLQGKNFSFLPVVLPPKGKVVVGILKREDVLTAYNQRLLKDRMLQRPAAKGGRKGKPDEERG